MILIVLDIFVDVINIINEPRLDYMGVGERAIQREFYSWWVHGGLKWTL